MTCQHERGPSEAGIREVLAHQPKPPLTVASSLAAMTRHRDQLLAELAVANARLRAAERERDVLKRDNEHQRAVIEERFGDAARLAMAGPVNDGFEFQIRSPLVRLMAAHLAETLRDMGAENYVQTEMHHADLGPLVMTIQRRRGKSPARVNAELKQELDTLKALLNAPPPVARAAGRNFAAPDPTQREIAMLLAVEDKSEREADAGRPLIEDRAPAMLEVMQQFPDVLRRLVCSPDTQPHARYRHAVRGSTYVEIGRATLQQSGQFGPAEGDTIVVYRGEADGKLWARAAGEFDDGRFETLGPVPTDSVPDQSALCEAGRTGTNLLAAKYLSLKTEQEA